LAVLGRRLRCGGPDEAELAAVLAPGGAAEALVRAKEEGLVGAIGEDDPTSLLL